MTDCRKMYISLKSHRFSKFRPADSSQLTFFHVAFDRHAVVNAVFHITKVGTSILYLFQPVCKDVAGVVVVPQETVSTFHASSQSNLSELSLFY